MSPLWLDSVSLYIMSRKWSCWPLERGRQGRSCWWWNPSACPGFSLLPTHPALLKTGRQWSQQHSHSQPLLKSKRPSMRWGDPPGDWSSPYTNKSATSKKVRKLELTILLWWWSYGQNGSNVRCNVLILGSDGKVALYRRLSNHHAGAVHEHLNPECVIFFAHNEIMTTKMSCMAYSVLLSVIVAFKESLFISGTMQGRRKSGLIQSVSLSFAKE